MKKFLLSLAALAVLLGTGSCTTEKDQPANTQKWSGHLPTVIIPVDPSSPAEFCNDVVYSMINFYAVGEWSVAAANLKTSFAGTLNFRSPHMVASVHNAGIQMSFPSAFTVDNSTQTVSNLSLVIAQQYNYYLPDAITPLGLMYVLQYQVDNQFKAKTFPLTAYYAGNTVTRYTTQSGESKTFTTDSPMFNFNISSDLTSVEMVIYKPRFAEEMPELSRMVVKGLKIEPDRTYGYRITGTDINPVVGDGDHAVEYPSFKFKDIDFHPINDNLTQGQLTFKVGDRYEGTFRGSYLK